MPGKKPAKRKATEAEEEKKKKSKKEKHEDTELEDLCSILGSGQKSNATHKRLAGRLAAMNEKLGAKAFREMLWEGLGCVLVSHQSGCVDKILKLVNVLLVRLSDNEITNFLMEKTVECTESADKYVRRNCCELLHECLAAYNQDQADDDVLDKIAVASHNRLDDKAVLVRCKAIDSAYLLQQPSLGPQCDFTQHFLQLLSHDSHQVRVGVLNRIEISKHLVPHLLRLTSDVSPAVRKLAYKHISRLPPSWLGIQERIDLFTRGLAERSEPIRKLTHVVLQNWLKRENGDASMMLSFLDIELHEKVTTQVAEVVFDVKFATPSLGKDETILAWDTAQRDALSKVLTAESVLMLRVIVQKLKEKDSERADIYAPPIDTTADLLKGCIDVIAETMNPTMPLDLTPVQAGLLAEQVLKLCVLYEPDLHTEAQRQHILTAIYTFANITQVDHPTRFVGSVVSLFKHFYVHREEELHRMITIIIDRLKRYMSTTTEEIIEEDNEDLFFDAEAQARADQGKQDLINHTRTTVYSIKSKVEGLRRRNDTQLLHKELAVLAEQEELLGHLEGETATDTALWVRIVEIITHVVAVERGVNVPEQYAQVVLAASQSHWNAFIRSKALRVLAVYSVTKRSAAPTYSQVMLTALRKSSYHTHERCRFAMCEALNGLIDTFLEHGPAGFYTAPHAVNPSAPGVDHLEAARDKAVVVLKTIIRFACHGDSTWEGTDMEFENEPVEEAVLRKRALQGVATAGLTKLLSCNRVPEGHEAKVLAQLLLFYFNPAFSSNKGGMVTGQLGEGDSVVHAMQMLTVFFPAYAFSSTFRQRMVRDASVEALRHIARDSYHVVPADAQQCSTKEKFTGMHTAFLAFVANLTDAAELKALRKPKPATAASDEEAEQPARKQVLDMEKLKTLTRHEELAAICLLESHAEHELGDKTIPKKFLKLLTHLRLYNPAKATELGLLDLVQHVLPQVQDKTLLNSIQKWKDTLVSQGVQQRGEDLTEELERYSASWAEEVGAIPYSKKLQPDKSPKKARQKKKKEEEEELTFDVKLDYQFSDSEDEGDTGNEPEQNTKKKARRASSTDSELF
eukprot:TRINITY_DN3261_c0_g1_i4.p1 TRINITY_DN3261_c0_g1~~TRINITY_DN3261_c0_g1_i4.p1  ORF type:complete len:1101 (+),score=297.86 TRINITY_DN3261_c0_g1_i4:58-3303(+)